jgi:hypothetical protein
MARVEAVYAFPSCLIPAFPDDQKAQPPARSNGRRLGKRNDIQSVLLGEVPARPITVFLSVRFAFEDPGITKDRTEIIARSCL